jgi:hypothetical protein
MKGYGKKRSWPNLRYYPNICSEAPMKTMKNLGQDSRSLGWNFNPGPSKYKAGMLTNQSWHLVTDLYWTRYTSWFSVSCVWVALHLLSSEAPLEALCSSPWKFLGLPPAVAVFAARSLIPCVLHPAQLANLQHCNNSLFELECCSCHKTIRFKRS